ncbi:type II secretion system secretin GspD [Synergistaceae bacterium OttesenSCG-928-D05]|nr:type II secretion system secretin GspD [Synergistaceae bacterium OttesenSCG-928-D05]
MKTKKKILPILILMLLFAASVSAFPVWAADADMEEQNLIEAAREMRQTGRIQLNFKDLEIAKFLRFMSELLGENILVDPAVNGKVSVISPKPMSIDESRQVMLSVLEMNNLAIQDMGSYSKVGPLSAGPSVSNTVVRSDASILPSDQVAVQVVPLSYVKAGYVVAPLKSAIPQIQIAPLGDGNGVLITGKATLLSRAASVIRALDAPDSIRTTKIFSLAYASAKLVEGHVNALAKDQSSKLAGMVALGDERTRRIILVGSKPGLDEAERILKALDVPSRTENFHVYKLHNADAKTVAEQLSSILAVAAQLSGSKEQGGTPPSTVVPDLPTNSLIFTASQEQFNSLKEILDKLDTQPKQVLLRGMIAEVNLNKLNSAGIDWAAWGGAVAGDLVLAGNAQLGSTGVPSDIISLYQSLITTEELVDRNGSTYSVTNTDGKGLMYAYVKLLNKYDALNVLSMPRLMCTDNLESHLQVGQVIPQMTGSLTDSSNTGSVTNSYEYKDVGLILTVTPHIRSGNLVALEIEQRIEDVITTQNSTTPITSKREIKTNVLVANGETVVLGGLIREAEKALRNRVPVLSYIPLIGNLFKSNEKQREKIDLMIFLTPYILETPQDASRITNDIVSGRQPVSEAELSLLMRNHEDYEKSVRQENISREMLDPFGYATSQDKTEEQSGPVEVEID